MKLGNAMKVIREEMGLSRREMADRLSIKQSGLWKIEAHKVIPKWKTVSKFIVEAHIPVAYFFSRAMDLEDYICP